MQSQQPTQKLPQAQHSNQAIESFTQGQNQSASLNTLLNNLASIVEGLLLETDILECPTVTCFHAPKRPSITLQNYLQRLGKYCGCSEECYILALIYLDKIQDTNPDIVLNSLCVHRFFMTAVVVAVKYHDDEYFKNEFYAKVGGIPKQELNKLEQEFLDLIDYQVHVDPEIFYEYKTKIFKYTEI